MKNYAVYMWLPFGIQKFGFNVPPWSSQSASDSGLPWEKLIDCTLRPSQNELNSSQTWDRQYSLDVWYQQILSKYFPESISKNIYRHYFPRVALNFTWRLAVLPSSGKVSFCPKVNHKRMSQMCIKSVVSCYEKRYSLCVLKHQIQLPKLKHKGDNKRHFLFFFKF